MKQLAGKWALVTGSSRGIGQQIAQGLAEHGCNIVVHARKLSNAEATLALVREKGVEAVAVEGDLASEEGVASVIRAVKAGPAPIDILYNNAAIQNDWKDIWDITIADWQASFQTNVWALVTLCQAFAPEMKERGYGRIINLSSGIGGVPQLAPYSVSKAAVDKYTIDLAAELRGSNVLVNALDPGWLRTDLGGPNGMFEVEAVLPGALVPALLEDNGQSGHKYSAMDYRLPSE